MIKMYCTGIVVLIFSALLAPARAQPPARADVAKATQSIIEKTNAFRKEHNLPPVKPQEQLTAAAQYFAKFMARTGKYSHTADDRQPAERAAEHGYEFCIVLENIAFMFSSEGYRTDQLADGFTQGWIDSPGHRKNMVDPDITDTGVAIVRDNKGKYYAVQMFGRPESMAIAFTIKNEAGEEFSYTVSGQRYTLPPRFSQMHTVCRPPEVSFDWKAEQTLTPAKNATLTVTRNRRGEWVVSQQQR